MIRLRGNVSPVLLSVLQAVVMAGCSSEPSATDDGLATSMPGSGAPAPGPGQGSASPPASSPAGQPVGAAGASGGPQSTPPAAPSSGTPAGSGAAGTPSPTPGVEPVASPTSGGGTGNVPAPAGGGGTTAGATNGGAPPAAGAAGSSETGGGGASPGRVLGEPNATAKNPIVTHVFTADPSADVYEGRVYVFTSHDPDDQSGYDMTDYHAFSSDDMVNWQDHGVVLDSANVSWTDRFYAPDSCYSAANDRYFLYFPNSGSAIGVAVSDRPGGPFEDAIGRPLIDGNTPGVGDVDWLFDPTCFIDDDGQAYLYFGGGPSGTGENARVIRLGEDMTSLADNSATTIVAPDFFEASFMHKRDGRYYYSYSTGFDNHAAYIDYMMSDQPMTGFEYVGTILASPNENNGDNNHHSMVEYEGQWYIFYHNRVLANQVGKSNYQRSITLDLMSYDGQGLINEVPTTMGEVPQLRAVDALAKVEAELIAAESGIETDWVLAGGQTVGVAVTDLQDGDWIGVSQLDFGSGATLFRARVASAGGATIEVHQGGCDGFRGAGTEVGSCEVPDTGGGQEWEDVECEVQAEGGVHDLCLRFAGGGGQLLSLDHYQFE